MINRRRADRKRRYKGLEREEPPNERKEIGGSEIEEGDVGKKKTKKKRNKSKKRKWKSKEQLTSTSSAHKTEEDEEEVSYQKIKKKLYLVEEG